MILACLLQAASTLPTDASALERAISALEKEIKTLDNSSVPLEHSLPWFTGIVAFGVALEFWVIWREHRDDMTAWRRGIVRTPDRPSTLKLIVEVASVLLIAGGIVGELWAGVRITSINGNLRSKSAELRSKSDQLLSLVTRQAGEAKERAAKNERDAAVLRKEAEDEHMSRIKLEERVAWRTISPKDIKEIGARLRKHAGVRAIIGTLADNAEAVSFADDIREVLRAAHWQTPEVQPFSNLGKQRFGLRISTTRDFPSWSAAFALDRELSRFGPEFDEEDKVFNGGGNGIYVFVQLRPRIVPVAQKSRK